MCRTWITFSVLAIAAIADGKLFEPVELARKLHSIKISDWDIPSLVCLAHNASNLDTSHTEVMNLKALKKNITFYGVFGIPEVWLSDCSLEPFEVLDEDIEDDVKCVLHSLANRLSLFDRTDYLGALTPHIVDLNKCFDWWEHLPRYLIYPGESHVTVDCAKPTAAALSSDTHHTSAPPHKPHPPVTTTCKCDSNGGSLIVDFSLIFLNIVLVALCYILWVSFVQRRTVKSDTVQFI
uniref:Lysozyme c-1 n=1 Tax=Lygus hesperus TaxID=30085 RepID=A0A146MDA8_LYGHE